MDIKNIDIENAAQLRSYLIDLHHIKPYDSLEIHVLHGGVSNRTVLVEFENGKAWVLKQALEKLRVKVDWFCSPERVHREALGIKWLEQLAPPGSTVPLIFEDVENHIIAMQAVPQPHENWKTALLNGGIQDHHIRQFAKLLAVIHGESQKQKDELSQVFADRTFMEQLRIEPFYEYPAAVIPQSKPFLSNLIAKTRSVQTALVHGDFSPKNILVHQDRLILLDHEVIHFGDPAFDIGFSMAHLLSKAHALIHHRAAFQKSAAMYWQHYYELIKHDEDQTFEQRCIHHTLGCLLARAAGRSTMDYFSNEHKQAQTTLSVQIMQSCPHEMNVFIELFMNGLNNNV